jgi:alkylation response protein AidB-like acyl-CoA dehydrogenase
MRAPGVDVRPLRQITGEAEYNEVFLDGVRIPDTDRIGPVGEGWKVAMATLSNERTVGRMMSRGGVSEELIGRALKVWEQAPPSYRNATRRDRLARLWTAGTILRLTCERAEARPTPGPEDSITHFQRSRWTQELMEFCMELRGAEAMLIDNYDMTRPVLFSQPGSVGEATSDLTKTFLATRAMTITGGTVEVNKTILGERVLGLPREPRADTGPWSQRLGAPDSVDR